MTFSDGAAILGSSPLSGNTATFDISGLSVGPHSITATYGGDAAMGRVLVEVSIETVRTQLKSIYTKTDTHRQVELAQRIWWITAGLSPPAAGLPDRTTC